ncbi:MAG TPA: HAMP domain-containing sensor histidine kinase [Arenimonas sp.]|nr:HAMP domain-containing sensor histidine kinase [Arenimonas sp.]HPW33559.1 HAMP domain-containing sensor histidine kinase [Arenimonas sp.]
MATSLLNNFKGHLFWRIFLGLWLSSTLLLVVPALLFSQIAQRELPPNIQSRIESIILANARSAILEYRVAGQAQFKRTLDNYNAQLDTRLYIFSSSGKTLGSSTNSSEATAYLDLLLRGHETRLKSVKSMRKVFVLARWVTFEQQKYAVVAYFRLPDAPELEVILPSLWPILLASLFIAGVGSAFAARALVRPIYQLQSVTRQFAAGHLDKRIGPSLKFRNDEFSDLGNDFDWMAERLTILIDDKHRLMRDISHELRSPLARIRLALALTSKPEKFESALQSIDRDIDRMDILIGEILTLAKLEHSNFQHQMDAVDLRELCEEIVEQSQMEANSKQQSLRLNPGPSVPYHGDASLLHRAIENIVRNALQHTPAGSEIWLDAGLSPDTTMAEVSVSDNGPGVPASMLNQLCTPFFRIEGGHGKGSGLGLSIASRVVGLHSGTLHIDAASETGGLKVLISLPLKSIS